VWRKVADRVALSRTEGLHKYPNCHIVSDTVTLCDIRSKTHFAQRPSSAAFTAVSDIGLFPSALFDQHNLPASLNLLT
jgi:hypothetical protein